jgi:hypothetical protein
LRLILTIVCIFLIKRKLGSHPDCWPFLFLLYSACQYLLPVYFCCCWQQKFIHTLSKCKFSVTSAVPAFFLKLPVIGRCFSYCTYWFVSLRVLGFVTCLGGVFLCPNK